MQLILISISHAKAPLNIREKVSFTKRKQAQILDYIKLNIAEECVILSTCNRCEFYMVGEEGTCKKMIAYLILLAGADIKNYIDIYKNDECCKQLMLTASGLKSMIIGEDQILGQVKEAHEFAKDCKASGKYLNTLFRMAITGAKKVKTETLLSKTPVSAATISIKLCRNILKTLDGKNILIIGASGKTGSIILKDLLSVKKDGIYATSRTHGEKKNIIDGAAIIDYEKRYKNLDMYDVVISATSSPHIVLERNKIKSALKTKKTRVFIDLAVPRDIDADGEAGIIYKNIDDLREIAETNNKIKILEAKKAESILRGYIDEFRVWKLFTEEQAFFFRLESKFTDDEQIRCFRREIYKKKAEKDYENFRQFIDTLKEKSNEH